MLRGITATQKDERERTPAAEAEGAVPEGRPGLGVRQEASGRGQCRGAVQAAHRSCQQGAGRVLRADPPRLCRRVPEDLFRHRHAPAGGHCLRSRPRQQPRLCAGPGGRPGRRCRHCRGERSPRPPRKVRPRALRQASRLRL